MRLTALRIPHNAGVWLPTLSGDGQPTLSGDCLTLFPPSLCRESFTPIWENRMRILSVSQSVPHVKLMSLLNTKTVKYILYIYLSLYLTELITVIVGISPIWVQVMLKRLTLPLYRVNYVVFGTRIATMLCERFYCIYHANIHNLTNL